MSGSVTWKDVKATIECSTDRVVAKVVDYCACSIFEYCRETAGVELADGKKRYSKLWYKECLNTYSVQLYRPLLPGMHFILVPQLDDHVGLGNRVFLEFRKIIAIVMRGSGVNGPDPKPRVH
jgi:hypothetical protein